MLRYFTSLFARDKPVQSKGILLGLDYAGKTTLLYKLKGGDVMTTIPTIGFNVESIETPNWNFQCWDVGGCDKIRPLWKHYISDAQFLVFVHDCSDQERLVESTEELQHVLSEFDEKIGKHVFILLNKQDLLDDESRSKKLGDIQQRFERASKQWKSKFHIEIMNTPGLNCKTGDQLDRALARMKDVLVPKKDSQIATGRSMAAQIEKTAPLPSPPSEAQLIERIKQADAISDNSDKFWNDFMAADLPAWDHFTHLRAGYFVMIDEMSTGKNIFECADTFVRHLERLRSARPDRFRNTEHRTMTIFWLVQLHTAAIGYSADNDGYKVLPSKDKFSAVLHYSPHLMNSGVWRDYYTKEVMFSPEAKKAWHVPDIQPLPSNLVDSERPLEEKS